ncbi:glycosyltransferase family 2 protein [Candidatus Frankia alpina]|uniref:glycosyltransferase family 2 protein n=1 Tax=Candidatus Frankia alpina TaxID=2699483 RepID=UPI001F2E5251|nr:glycosyltransferase family 2 protein [Candidatus Frankia alpina]
MAGRGALLDQIVTLAGARHRWRGATISPGRPGEVLVILPVRSGHSAEAALDQIVRTIAGHEFVVDGRRLRVTPVPGFVVVDGTIDDAVAIRRARLATERAARQRDLVPVGYHPAMEPRAGRSRRARRPLRNRLRPSDATQIVLSTAICVGVPFLAYTGLFALGVDPTAGVFTFLVIALVGTALTIYLEQLSALEAERCPAAPFPPASAVIAAYLPNEAATIVETVRAFLRLDYPGPLRVILAYSTPQRLPVEDVLDRLAAADPRLLLVHVADSTSKAQNVNAAIPLVTGEFVGIFDADHHPAPDSFERAWRWLSNGAAVVQGHCVIRNGSDSRVSRTVAVEFESIYAVSHPGRARMHGFGIFGGSNGYWRIDLLHQIRMRGSMLTEDIDASLRAILRGARIVSDPELVSYELAPTTVQALWRQRLRWAQGWHQAARQHLRDGLGAAGLTARQKLGLFWLLGWREIYPWLSLQIYPLILFSLLHPKAGHGFRLNVSLYIVAAAFSALVGPIQALFAFALADSSIRRHPGWFVRFSLVNIVYSEFKNVIARLAPVKELMRDREWHVTPRAAAAPSPADQDDLSPYADGADGYPQPPAEWYVQAPS